MFRKEFGFYEQDNKIIVKPWNREYTVENTEIFSSLKSGGDELLASPVRIVSRENGKDSIWGKKKAFVLDGGEDFCTVVTSAASQKFVANTALHFENDGFVKVDFKIMPRGKTVQQVFGLADYANEGYNLESLWLEIPLKPEMATLYHFYPGDGGHLNDTELSGALQDSLHLGFKSIVWLGNEKAGLCFTAETDEMWQYKDKAVEIIKNENETMLRLRLLDSFPEKWKSKDFEEEEWCYLPITYTFALQATPTKPYPKNPYKRKILHIDCFCKVKEDYYDFLGNKFENTEEVVYDRIKRLGVTTLILHEKWNLVQNYWKVPPIIQDKIKTIIKECHTRGIEVIPYFGYEMCALSDYWAEDAKEYLREATEDGYNQGGWYRMPHQREYIACYGSGWGKKFTDGVLKLIEDYGFDGVYLDTTAVPWGCMNSNHGCGYTDKDGKRHLTYPVFATREVMKTLYDNLDPKGKIVNPHTSNCCNIPALTYCHLNTDGELIQMLIRDEGTEAIPEGYLRSEYTGRNFGFPIDFLSYEYPPDWIYENSLPIALTLGIIPRVNNTGRPLEYMSKVWKIMDGFPMDESTFKGYWEKGDITFTDESVKLSYYQAEDKYLIFMGKVSKEDAKGKLSTKFKADKIKDMLTGKEINTDEEMTIKGNMPYILIINKE